MINIHEGKAECDDHLWSCFHSSWIANQGLPIVLYTPVSCVHFRKFYIGLDFDKNLKANIKTNDEKLRQYEYKFGNKTILDKIVHYSAIHCVNLRTRLNQLLVMSSIHWITTMYIVLRSGNRLRSILRCRTSRFPDSFVPGSIRMLNKKGVTAFS